MSELVEAAIGILRAGYSVIPCGPDKKASITWGKYQTDLMAEDEARRCFANAPRLAIIGGKVSGNLECLDIDDPTTYEPFLELLEMRCPGLPAKLLKRQTPSGGYHLIYRCSEPVAGNLKLACKENGEVRIETRGEGGYFLSPPSDGYEIIEGSMSDCPTLTPEEVQAIHTTAKALDLRQSVCRPSKPTASIGQMVNGDAPGTRFNQTHSVEDLLRAQGWKEDKRTTAGTGWTRPGKESGTSGVLLENGNFYVWSANAGPLEPGRSYDAFGLFTMFNHGGDFPAAARELAGSAPKNTIKKPELLPDELLPVEPFDFALLPDSLRPWAQDICELIQCPPDFVGVGIMVSLAAVLGRKIGIRPQARTPWTVTPNLWGLVVGRPGVLKSPALDTTLAPLNRLVMQANVAFGELEAEYKHALTIADMRAEASGKAARKALANAPDADISTLLACDMPTAPILQRYKTNDSTPASLGELLRQNANGLLVYRDELVSLLKGLDREDQAEGRGFYLTGWNGDSPYTFDRIGRGLNLHIDAVCLSILGGTQPGRLAEYIRHAVKGGAADDGLIQRFGLMVWPDTGGTWKDVDRWPDNDAKNEAFKVFDYLDKLDLSTIGAEQDTDIDGNPEGQPYLRFDPGGLELFLEWRIELENRLRGNELHPALESHFAKYRKLIPALALIIHLADGGTGPVNEAATLQALAWGEYLETHARRAYGAVSQPEVATAKAIIAKIKKGDLPESFTSNNITRPGWAKLSDREQVADALRLLVDYGWLWEERTETGGRPTIVYHTIEGGQE